MSRHALRPSVPLFPWVLVYEHVQLLLGVLQRFALCVYQSKAGLTPACGNALLLPLPATTNTIANINIVLKLY